MKAQLPEGAQYRLDQQLLVQLQGSPINDDGVVTCCRLILRYQGNKSADAIHSQALAILESWGLDRVEAFRCARVLWSGGYRPPGAAAEQVGSGADVLA